MPTDFERMADLTRRVCEKGEDECSRLKDLPYRCCEPRYCEIADVYARSKGVILEQTGNVVLKFMGEHGCAVPPELRPICTVHVCTIVWANKSHIEHDQEKTKEYFELRRKLNGGIW